MPYANTTPTVPPTVTPVLMERRSFQMSELRVSDDDGKGQRLVGHAAVFNVEVELWPGSFEVIAPGAFARSIREKADVRALINHDATLILGRTKAGTLQVSEDKTGLACEITLPDTSFAKDLVESIDRGDLDTMSFAFRTVKEEWTHSPKKDLRKLLDVDLRDVSVATYAAYPDTDIALRSHDGWQAERERTAESHRRAMRMRLRLAEHE